jgi:hypothetical protein
MFLRTASILAAFSLSGAAFAEPMFTADEYAGVTTAAVNQFKVDMPAHVSMFSGISLTRNVQGGADIGVLANIYMVMDGGAPSVAATYNCVKQGANSIQCNPG